MSFIKASCKNAVMFVRVKGNEDLMLGFIVENGNCQEVEAIYNEHYSDHDLIESLSNEQRGLVIENLKKEIGHLGYNLGETKEMTYKQWCEQAFNPEGNLMCNKKIVNWTNCRFVYFENKEVIKLFNKFVRSQKSLDSDFKKVINENFEELLLK